MTAFRIAIVAALALTTGGAMAETLKVGIAAEPYPPFTVPDVSGNWSGFEIDFANAICAKMGDTCEITPTSWDGIIPALTSKKIDMIVASMSITEDRMKTIDFSDPYYNTPAVLVGAKDAPDYTGPDQLKGKILGVQTATTHQSYADKHFAGIADIKVYQTQDEANQDLASGRIDYVQADILPMTDYVNTETGKACCRIVGQVEADKAILGNGVGVGLRKGDTALKDKVNKAIADIRADGTYKTINDKYFTFDVFGE
ncbi:transporter substrate-binding domain-containing protein [Paracoccus pacificus]|uniref:Transporter substrate-binding domain-containing protein n=1 Tax=Paracoccus pacificus TaxID=1463598 RepID=A0ABW4R459_9RHOB